LLGDEGATRGFNICRNYMPVWLPSHQSCACRQT
jgi:hypothetical protein